MVQVISAPEYSIYQRDSYIYYTALLWICFDIGDKIFERIDCYKTWGEQVEITNYYQLYQCSYIFPQRRWHSLHLSKLKICLFSLTVKGRWIIQYKFAKLISGIKNLKEMFSINTLCIKVCHKCFLSVNYQNVFVLL